MGFITAGVWFLAPIIAAVALLVRRAYRDDRSSDSLRVPAAWTAGVTVAVFVIVTILNCVTVIGARNVGVEVAFGKTQRTLGSGLHVKAPWTDVVKFDGTIQSLTLKGAASDDNNDQAVKVMMSDGTQASIEATLQWQINSDDKAGVRKLYENYRKPERIDENFVERQLRSALFTAFRTYNPSAGIIEGQQESLVDVSARAMDLLSQQIKTQGITLRSLTISDIGYDDATKKRFADMRNAALQRQVAELQAQTAKKQAEANSALSKGSKDDSTARLLCLNITAEALRQGHTLPAGWSCMGGAASSSVPLK